MSVRVTINTYAKGTVDLIDDETYDMPAVPKIGETITLHRHTAGEVDSDAFLVRDVTWEADVFVSGTPDTKWSVVLDVEPR